MLKKHKFILSLLIVSLFGFASLPLQAADNYPYLILKRTATTLKMMKAHGLMEKTILFFRI